MRIPKRVREAALLLWWADGHHPDDFDDVPQWQREAFLSSASEALAEIDGKEAAA